MTETTAKEIMTQNLISATEDMTIEEALKTLINFRITGLPVIDRKGKMKGVISEFDILTHIAKSKQKGSGIFQEKITFSEKVDVVRDDTPLSKIVEEFIGSKFRRLPVVDHKGNLVGIITRRDLMRVFYYRARLEE